FCRRQKTDEVFLRLSPRQSAFPEGKVDFLQLVAEKTEEGFPGSPEGSLPCAKGGVANGDGGIVIPSR
ncbi:MAG: hypothetical protein IJA70_06170, partial [Oscillospiraceae bacterium]|nr:hypothetical protein [Oscillospiraceae bacterium]